MRGELISDSSCKGLWHLNGSSADSSGNGKNGTDAHITYSGASGKFGIGVSANADGSKIAIPANTLGTIGTGDFAVVFWFNPQAPVAAHRPMLFGSFDLTPSKFYGPTIFYDPLNVLAGGNAIVFRLRGDNQQFVTTPSASSMYGKWWNIVFTRISGQCYVYYNASLVKTFADNTNIPAADDAYIFTGNGAAQSQPTGAKGDEFAVYNVGWSPQRVKQYYNNQKGIYIHN
jgi:hypothetical protein